MSSGPKVLVAGALKILQDLSNGSNVPALQPLVSLAVRIYTSAEGAKSNKKKAKALAQEVCNSIEQIKQVYPAGSSSASLYEDGIGDFQRVLEDVATFVEKIVQRNCFWRIVNQEEDRQELSDYRTKITEGKLQFLVAMEFSKSQILQREQKYPVFTLADLELQQMLNETNPNHTRAIARLVPHRKLVMLRQYPSKSTFEQDIEGLMTLRHPNLPFIGASSLLAPAPFIVMELSMHNTVREVVWGLSGEPPKVLQRKAIQIITGVLDGMNHLRKNDRNLSGLIKQLSGIQYDGSKVILNVELPKHKPRSTVVSPLPDDPFKMFNTPRPGVLIPIDEGGFTIDPTVLGTLLQPFLDAFCSNFSDEDWVDVPEQENEVLQELFGLPDNPTPTAWVASALPPALWPVWQYLMECDESDRRLHDLRDISGKLCGPSNQAIDIPRALVATGNFPYQDFPPTYWTDDIPLRLGTVAALTKQGRRVVVCNILGELCDKGIITMDHFISTNIHDDEEQDPPSAELIRAGSGFFTEAVGDYTRYSFCGKRPFSLEMGRTTTKSLHDPSVAETRRRIQEYFHRRLPSLLKENLWAGWEPADGVVLVTSVRSSRTTELSHNHPRMNGPSPECLQCMVYESETPQPANPPSPYPPPHPTLNPPNPHPPPHPSPSPGPSRGPNQAMSHTQNLNIKAVYFHALPEQFMERSGLVEQDSDRWGHWTISVDAHEVPLEPKGFFSYEHSANCGFQGVFAQLLD